MKVYYKEYIFTETTKENRFFIFKRDFDKIDIDKKTVEQIYYTYLSKKVKENENLTFDADNFDLSINSLEDGILNSVTVSGVKIKEKTKKRVKSLILGI